tara:strand:+ start:493 stop:666 length:174 start_codon:yes stop_codon:yes gene_type:complete
MNKIEKIILNAVDITRWADKGFTYPFLDEEERQEIANRIFWELDKNGYEIREKNSTK